MVGVVSAEQFAIFFGCTYWCFPREHSEVVLYLSLSSSLTFSLYICIHLSISLFFNLFPDFGFLVPFYSISRRNGLFYLALVFFLRFVLFFLSFLLYLWCSFSLFLALLLSPLLVLSPHLGSMSLSLSVCFRHFLFLFVRLLHSSKAFRIRVKEEASGFL